MGPALWPQRWELSHSHPIGMKVWRYETEIMYDKVKTDRYASTQNMRVR